MIVAELQALRDFVCRTCTVNCEIGQRDRSPDTYPMVEIVPDRDMPVFYSPNASLRCVTVPLTVRIIVSEKSEMDALNIFERMCANLPSFSPEKGHELAGNFSGAYSESKYTLAGELLLRFRIAKP